MKKLLFIPRGLFDLLSIWFLDLSFKQKSSFTYTLFLLKWNKWLKPANTIIDISFKNYNLKVYNNDAVQFLFKEIFLNRVYQLPLCKAHKILDAGANIGFASLYFHDINPHAKINAYEPAQSAFDLLKINTSFFNRFVEIHKVALSDFNGTLIAETIDESASVNQTFSFSGIGSTVPCMKMSDVLKNDNYDVVKLDVEGAEENILKDCFEEDIVETINCWFIEFHNALPIPYWIKKFEAKQFHIHKKENVYCFWK